MRHNSHSLPNSPRSGKVFRNSRFGNSRPPRQGQYIHPDKFINKAIANDVQPEKFAPVHTFADFGLIDLLQNTLTQRGYAQPTPIQDKAIAPALEGRDVIGLADTGSGKTAAFILPLIQRLAKNPGMALIIAPTRELAVQIDAEFKSFAKGLNLYSAICVGGVNIGGQIRQLSRRPQVVIGTPGRLKDLYGQGILKLEQANILVLDEVDRMLDMGFINDIRFILDKLPTVRQSLCFSATLTPEIKRLLDPLLRDPVSVSVRTSLSSDHVEQDVIKAVSKDHKIEILIDLLKKDEFEKVMVFGATKWSVQRLAETLTKAGIKSEAIHGNKSQPQRQRALQAFKDGRVRVLVATDVAARGLDIPQVSHVINFDQPTTYQDYTHRIGRTGRAGAPGQALTFVA